MKNLYSESQANDFVSKYRKRGVSKDLALRVYTSRLLGKNPNLVLHGGGNTSVKCKSHYLSTSDVETLHIKGSGWDMEAIEPEGLPATRMDVLLPSAELTNLSDESMVSLIRSSLFNSNAPTPSIETLLHAFIPHKFIDHTHANAVLSVSNQNEGNRLTKELFEESFVIVPYVMPGFKLARLAKQLFDNAPHKIGLILENHGIFTFGESAAEAYGRMITHVSRAESLINKKTIAIKRLPKKEKYHQINLNVSKIATIIRRETTYIDNQGETKQYILEHRTCKDVQILLANPDRKKALLKGNVTPDHVIRTKRIPLILREFSAGDSSYGKSVTKAFARFKRSYDKYFFRNDQKSNSKKIKLDSIPRVVVVPNVGIFGLGKSKKEAKITADIAENSVRSIADAEKLGEFRSISEYQHFEMEYWSLEQAKLRNITASPLTGRVTVITGGAGTIGLATARYFKDRGAEVVLFDIKNRSTVQNAESEGIELVECDVTKNSSVQSAFRKTVCMFGGLDIIVSNAGMAWDGKIGDVSEKILRQSFETNFFSHHLVAKTAVSIFIEQGNGGVLLFNASKQAINPGKNFGPYGIPKAATIALAKQFALDYGEKGIRVNVVNADRIRSGLLTDSLIKNRAKARGLDDHKYMSGNLLNREVQAEDVAKAFYDLATSQSTTGAILTVDGGNISASLR